MGKVLIVGAGGVGRVVAHKCAQVPEVFEEIVLASRTVSKCETIRDEIQAATGRAIATAAVDADDVDQTAALLERERPFLVINVALPYQDLSIMEACLRAGVHYLDTANYEPPEEAKFHYGWQWAYKERFEQAGLMALLGCGFDPGVTGVFCAHALKHRFDRIDTIDILDCNAGDHGHPFATNFNPEINIREITQRGKYWEAGAWKETPPLSHHLPFDYPEIGPRESYLLYHEELESLAKNIPHLQRIRFWMTFGQEYLTHLRVLRNCGLTRIDEVEYDGKKIVPLKFLKAVLPDPAGLGKGYSGKTNIGCLVNGEHQGKPRQYYVYNICDHAACFQEVKAQAVSYTTGVPAMIGALLMLTQSWSRAGVWNVEEFDPDPFMDRLNQHGLPWREQDLPPETDFFESIQVDEIF